jgi:hypothetical protein
LNKVKVGMPDPSIGHGPSVTVFVPAASATVITVAIAGIARVTRFCDNQEDLATFKLLQTTAQSVLRTEHEG